jgi:ficolin
MIVTIVLLLVAPSYCFEVRTAKLEVFQYDFAEYSEHKGPDSSSSCAAACVTLNQGASSQCAAYQWHPQSSTCRTQKTLNITRSDTSHIGIVVSYELFFDCAAILAAYPNSQSGVFTILPGTATPRRVWCDMDTDGGGWTVFLKRQDGSVDFYRDLGAYQDGFGNASGEYWLGLDALSELTSHKSYKFRAEVSDWAGAAVYSSYESIFVGNEASNYTLTLGAFIEGAAGDAMRGNSGQPFSAKGVDRDAKPEYSCAERHHGAFWYKFCSLVHPTAKYYVGGPYTSTHNDGIIWKSWPAHNDFWYSMKTVELKIRP